MGKALIVGVPGAALSSGAEFNSFGSASISTTEANNQLSCTEGATFSNMRASITSGNSGTATFTFRDAGADGSETFQITGTGANEDTVNTDVLSAGDLFNIAYTDTGTNSTLAWLVANVAFASGHGNFHGACRYAGSVFDAPSATRFIQFYGSLINDGVTGEASTQWKARAYTSWEAMQVRVTANARTNNSDFTNRIDGAPGSLLCQFTTGATGLITDSSPADSLADGSLLNFAITLDTGVEDLAVVSVVATVKSTSTKSETIIGEIDGLDRPASATANYIPIGGYFATLGTSETAARIKPGFAAVVSNLRCYLSANTYTGNGTLKLYQNGIAVITSTITASGGAAWYENTSDTITIDADDELSFEFDEGTSGSITIHSAGIMFAPLPAGGPFPPWPQMIYQPIALQN